MILLSVLVGVFGLAIGSFLNVVIYRVPLGKSVVSPRSSCPHCGAEIKARDNVPIVSWLVLRGKCRNCGAPISPRYPLVELGTGVAYFVVAYALAGSILNAQTAPAMIAAILVLVAYLYLAAISIALSLIDLDVHKLHNSIIFPSYAVGIVLFVAASILTSDFSHLVRALIAMAAMGLGYLLLALAYPKGMGLGDVKFAGLLGLFLGWVGWGAVVVGALAAFLLGGVFGVILILARKANRKSGIPFGPWMAAGAWLGIAIGDAVLANYLSIYGLSPG